MKTREGIKIREIAGERVLILQGKAGADMTKIVALNETSEWRWNELSDKEFTAADVSRMLQGRFTVDAATADRDAAAWIETLSGCGAIVA